MNLPRRKIADGIHANYLNGGKFKVHSITVGIEIPLDLKSVTSANLLSRVLNRGCKKYPDIKSLSIKLDDMYAAGLSLGVTRSGESEYLCLFTDFLSGAYTQGCDIIKETIDVIKEILLFPKIENSAFDPAYVSGEKKNLADDIDSLINNKAKYAKNRCIEELCKGDPYAISTLGDKEILSALDGSELYHFLSLALKHSRIEILYTGDNDCFDKVCVELTNAFSSLEREYEESDFSCIVRNEAKPICEVYEDMEINQGKLSLGMVTGVTNKSPDIGALIVANEIFGGSPNSKLFMNVREKMSLCYYCSSALDAVKGIMLVNAGIEKDNYEIAKNAILGQLEDVKAGKFTDEEFSSAVNSLINGYKSVADSVSSLETWYMPRIFRGEGDTPDSRIMQIRAVTREDVIKAANKINPQIVYFLRPSESTKEEC